MENLEISVLILGVLAFVLIVNVRESRRRAQRRRDKQMSRLRWG